MPVVLVTALGIGLLGVVAIVGLAVTADSGGTSEDPEAQVRDVVTEYMDALKKGDVEAAFAVSKPREHGGPEVLPTKVYERALEAAPIRDVVVKDPVLDEISGEVDVTYTVGGTPGKKSFSVHDYDQDGEWEMIPGGASGLVSQSLTGLDVTLNGAPVDQDQSYWLMPGAYEVAIDSPRLTLEGTRTLTVTDRTVPDDWAEPKVTKRGVKDYRAAVREEVETCLTDQDFDAGCEMDVTPQLTQQGWKPVDGTLDRSLSREAERKLERLEPVLDPGDDATAVSSDPIGPIDVTYTCTKGGQRGECELFLGMHITPTVDLTDPQTPVRWD